jgi:hypothetical protein
MEIRMADQNTSDRRLSLPKLRFSIRQLLIGTGFIAVGCVALRSASANWVAAMLGLTIVMLAAAVLCAVFRGRAERAFWIGFAVFGWLYVVVLMYGWSIAPNQSQGVRNPLLPDRLATTRIAAWLHERLFPVTTHEIPGGVAEEDPFAPPANFTPPPGGSIAGYSYGATSTSVYVRQGPESAEFINVAHALWTLVLALCGGWLARWLYLSRPEKGRTERATDLHG